jgi:glycosyltransferase involved in cell wall biosynthesis
MLTPGAGRPPLILHFFGASALGGSELGALSFIQLQPGFRHRALYLEPPGQATALYAKAGVPVASLALGRGGPLPATLRLRAQLAADPPDIVHAYGLRPSLLVRLLRRRPALVQAVRSVDAHRPAWQAVLDRRTATRVDCYLANSQAGARFLVDERGVAASHIRFVPNGIDAMPFAAADARRAGARALLGIGRLAPVILTVANLRPPKGLDVLADAATRLRDTPPFRDVPFVWLVAGDGPLAASLAGDLERRGLAGRVRLLGFRSDIADLLAAADVFCLTSRREGAPRSILEAMAAGRAVVATDVGGVSELVAAGETGVLVPRDDPGAIASALAALLTDPERSTRLGRAGRERVRAQHTLDRAAAAIAAAYDEVITRKTAASAPLITKTLHKRNLT